MHSVLWLYSGICVYIFMSFALYPLTSGITKAPMFAKTPRLTYAAVVCARVAALLFVACIGGYWLCWELGAFHE